MNPRKGCVVALFLLLSCTGCAGLVSSVKQLVGITPSAQESADMMNSSDPDVVREGVLAILERGDSDQELVEFWVQRLKRLVEAHPSQLVRSAAAATLGELGERAVSIPALLAALKDKTNKEVVLVDATVALAKLAANRDNDRAELPKKQCQEILAALTELYNSSLDEGVRREAVLAIGWMGDQDTIPMLVDAVAEESSQVRFGAAESLRCLTGLTFEADPDLWADWYEAKPDERMAIVQKWNEEQARLAEERGAQKGGFLHGVGSTLAMIGNGIGSTVSAGWHEVVLGYKRVRRSIFGHDTSETDTAPPPPAPTTDPK